MDLATFSFWFRAGTGHILAWDARDHLLFVAVLAAPCPIAAWRPLLVRVTGFTLGHSVTLALAALGFVPGGEGWVEVAIPLTITVSALQLLRQPVAAGIHGDVERKIVGLTTGFGLIHGLGFAGALQEGLGGARAMWAALAGFNVGVECGHIVAVAAIVAVVSGIAGLGVGRARTARGVAVLGIVGGLWMTWTRS